MNPALIGIGVGLAGFFLLRRSQQEAPAKSGAEKVAREAQKAGVAVSPSAPGDTPGIVTRIGDKIIQGNTGDTGIAETDESEIELFPEGFKEPESQPSDSITGGGGVLGGSGFAPGTDPSEPKVVTSSLFQSSLKSGTTNQLNQQIASAVTVGVPLIF